MSARILAAANRRAPFGGQAIGSQRTSSVLFGWRGAVIGRAKWPLARAWSTQPPLALREARLLLLLLLLLLLHRAAGSLNLLRLDGWPKANDWFSPATCRLFNWRAGRASNWPLGLASRLQRRRRVAIDWSHREAGPEIGIGPTCATSALGSAQRLGAKFEALNR